MTEGHLRLRKVATITTPPWAFDTQVKTVLDGGKHTKADYNVWWVFVETSLSFTF